MLSSKSTVDSKNTDQNKNAQKKTKEEVLILTAYLIAMFFGCAVPAFRMLEQYSVLSTLLS